MSVDLSEFVSGFLAEAGDHLRSINANLLLVDAAAQQQAANPRAARELFRSLHTMKGLAGMVGIEPIVEIAHAMERLLRDGERNAGRLPAEAIEPLLRGSKAIAQRVDALAAGGPVLVAPRDLLDALDSVDVFTVTGTTRRGALTLDAGVLARLTSSETEQLSRPNEAKHAYQIAFTPTAEQAARGVTITTVRERVASRAEIVKVVPITAKPSGALSFLLLVLSSAAAGELADLASTSLEQVSAITRADPEPLPEISEPEVESAVGTGMLRVAVPRVDAAMDGLGELMVSQFRLARAVAALSSSTSGLREVQGVLQEVHHRIRDVRALVLGLRMISLSELLDRLPILVRGLRASTGKVAQVELDVGRFEVDKSVGEQIWPVLVHLVRNAVDHGLESEAARLEAGKPAQGTIRVSCARSSNSRLEITIEDDGGGVNAEAVARRAGRPVPRDDDELLELIALPGLSTRDNANVTSGRGMGLDIARRIVVDELGGELRLRTTPGRGTCFTLEVPITVAVVDAFRVQSAAQSFLVPVASVEEFVDVEPGEVVASPVVGTHSRRAALLSRRGKAIPFLELSEFVTGSVPAPSGKAIIVRRNEQLFAFGVDRLLGHHEVVVRRLADPLVEVPGIAGSADLGDGQPTLLLDLVALTRVYGGTERAA